MATLEQIGEALKAAHAAGNVEDAKKLAEAYKRMQSESAVAPMTAPAVEAKTPAGMIQPSDPGLPFIPKTDIVDGKAVTDPAYKPLAPGESMVGGEVQPAPSGLAAIPMGQGKNFGQFVEAVRGSDSVTPDTQQRLDTALQKVREVQYPNMTDEQWAKFSAQVFAPYSLNEQMANGLLLSFPDEIAAASGMIGSKDPAQSFQILQELHSARRQAGAEQNGNLGLAMEVIGSLFSGGKAMPGSGVVKPATLADTAKSTGVVTGQSAAYGFGDADGDLGERATNALGAGATGAGIALGISALGRGAAALGNRKRVQAPNNEFDVPLTTGQTTGDLRQISKEERLRQIDGSGQPIMRQFDKTQRDAIDTAAENIGAKMGDPTNMVEGVTGRLKDKVAFSKDRAGSLYDIAIDEGRTAVDLSAVTSLPTFTKTQLADRSVIVDPVLTPAATRAMSEIEELATKARDAPWWQGEASLRGIEQVRKRLVGLSGATNEDRRAVFQIKQAFDNWLDDAVDNALISGDEAALKALKAARAETSVYKKLTTAKRDDPASSFIVKMQRKDATPEEVSNWLYGADIASPTLNAPKVAGRVKEVLGENSAEFGAVRAAAWQRLVKDLKSGDARSAQQIVTRIEKFLNEKGPTLSKVLFTKDQRDEMLRFVEVLKKTITPRDATNPSRSAWTLASMASGITKLLAAGAGMQLTGEPAVAIGMLMAAPIFKNVSAARAAGKATQGVDEVAAKTAPVTRMIANRSAAALQPLVGDQREKTGAALGLN